MVNRGKLVITKVISEMAKLSTKILAEFRNVLYLKHETKWKIKRMWINSISIIYLGGLSSKTVFQSYFVSISTFQVPVRHVLCYWPVTVHVLLFIYELKIIQESKALKYVRCNRSKWTEGIYQQTHDIGQTLNISRAVHRSLWQNYVQLQSPNLIYINGPQTQNVYQ